MPTLFSYGTLQDSAVQRELFGRLLEGRPDELVGFEQGVIEIEDPGFAAASGTARHAIVRWTGQRAHRVRGTALEVTDAELASADAYEPAGYVQVATTLASGCSAWVYADGRAPDRPEQGIFGVTATPPAGRLNRKQQDVTERFLREVVAIFVVAIVAIAVLLIARPWRW